MDKLRLSLILLISVLFSSCLTVKRIERNCDQFAKVCVDYEKIVEYRDTTIFIHDTISVKLPADTVLITDTLIVKDGTINLKMVRRQSGYAIAEAWVNNSRLFVNAYIADSSFLVTRVDTVFLNDVIKDTSQTQNVKIKSIPSFYSFTYYAFFVMTGLALVYLVISIIIKRFIR